MNDKILYCLVSLVSLFLFSNSVLAANCTRGGTAIDKEMLELTYMSKEELAEEYCLATHLKKVAYEFAGKFMDAGALDLGLETNAEGEACGSYATKVLRVAKKDHQVEVFECELSKPKL